MNDNTRDILSLLVRDLSTDILNIYGRIVANLVDVVSFCDLICYVDRYSQIFIREIGKCGGVLDIQLLTGIFRTLLYEYITCET